MTNVNATVIPLSPLGGATNAGLKLGFLDSPAKAAQNDTVTVTNAVEVVWVVLRIDVDGTEESATLSTNVITLTDSTTGNVSGLVCYR